MATTPVYGWPYPVGTDAADVPYWMQQLATSIEGTVSGGTTQPYVMVERTTSLSIPTGSTMTLVPWSSDADDQDNMWAGTPNPSRVTFNSAGRYRGMVLLTYQSNATGYRRVQVRKNAAGSPTGGTIVCTVTLNATAGGASTAVQGIFDQRFTAGEYIEVFAEQSSGGAINVGVTTGENWLTVERVLL